MQLSQMVPYRLLSSFFKDIRGDAEIWSQKKRLIEYMHGINKINRLPYVFEDGIGLQKKVVIDDIWRKMIIDNFSQIKGWVNNKKIRYIQDINPGVPGIVYKLEPEK